jgi:hypothetical protein
MKLYSKKQPITRVYIQRRGTNIFQNRSQSREGNQRDLLKQSSQEKIREGNQETISKQKYLQRKRSQREGKEPILKTEILIQETARKERTTKTMLKTNQTLQEKMPNKELKRKETILRTEIIF